MSSCDTVLLFLVRSHNRNWTTASRHIRSQMLLETLAFSFIVTHFEANKNATKCNILLQTSNCVLFLKQSVLSSQRVTVFPGKRAWPHYSGHHGYPFLLLSVRRRQYCLCMLHPLILLCLFRCGPRGRLPPASDTHPVCFSPRCAWKGLVTLTESGAGAQRCQLPPWALQLNPPANLQLKCW